MTLKSFHADVNIGDTILFRRFPGIKEIGIVKTKWYDWVETDDYTISRKQILAIIPKGAKS